MQRDKELSKHADPEVSPPPLPPSLFAVYVHPNGQHAGCATGQKMVNSPVLPCSLSLIKCPMILVLKSRDTRDKASQ